MKSTDKILITGSSGVLGYGLLKALKESGYNNLYTPNHKELDLLNYNNIKSYLEYYKPSYVFHLASIVYGIKGNEINQWPALIKNTSINQNLLLAISEVKTVKKIFYAGTVASYPANSEMPLREPNFFLGIPHDGEFGYACSKKYVYAYLVLLLKKFGIEFTYGIFTNIYGPNDRFNSETGHVIPSLIAKAESAYRSKTSLKIWGDPGTTRDFIYNEDAGYAALLAMNKSNGLINISSGKETTMKQVAASIVSNYKNLEYTWDSSKPIGISNRSVSNALLKGLGWKEKNSFNEGISKTISWYRNNPNKIRR